jgi:CRP/FNR family transcriptional regulator, cyclic AMP receptor protein
MTYSRGWPIEPVAQTARAARAAYARVSLAKQEELLAKVPMFADLKKNQIRGLARITETARFPANHEMVTEGDSGDFFGIMVEGTAEVIKGGGSIARIGSGDMFGELAIFDPGPRSATVRTLSDVVAIRITRGPFDEVVTADPRIALRVMQALARRLRETTELIP